MSYEVLARLAFDTLGYEALARIAFDTYALTQSSCLRWDDMNAESQQAWLSAIKIVLRGEDVPRPKAAAAPVGTATFFVNGPYGIVCPLCEQALVTKPAGDLFHGRGACAYSGKSFARPRMTLKELP